MIVIMIIKKILKYDQMHLKAKLSHGEHTRVCVCEVET